jgi:hypothetical protein
VLSRKPSNYIPREWISPLVKAASSTKALFPAGAAIGLQSEFKSSVVERGLSRDGELAVKSCEKPNSCPHSRSHARLQRMILLYFKAMHVSWHLASAKSSAGSDGVFQRPRFLELQTDRRSRLRFSYGGYQSERHWRAWGSAVPGSQTFVEAESCRVVTLKLSDLSRP